MMRVDRRTAARNPQPVDHHAFAVDHLARFAADGPRPIHVLWYDGVTYLLCPFGRDQAGLSCANCGYTTPFDCRRFLSPPSSRESNRSTGRGHIRVVVLRISATRLRTMAASSVVDSCDDPHANPGAGMLM